MLTKLVQLLVLITATHTAFALEPILGSEQKIYNTQESKDHWLILGAIQRISGSLKPEAETRLQANVTQWLWKLPEGHNSQEGFNTLKAQLSKQTTTLFECKGRECGLSNDFANQVFKQSILYGRDSDQYYWAGLSDGRKPSVWVIYTSQRSAKRVYGYVQKIELNKGEVDKLDGFVQQGLAQTLFDQGYIVLSKLGDETLLRDAQIQWLKSLLKENPNERFALVVHRYGGMENQALIERTQLQADGLLDQVAKAGGFIKNLYAHGGGAMLPRANLNDRIELVVLKK
ncbi:hypothetical protein NBRC116188_04870 [Oceaniserpentilla sp. 4NH20-0058]|uniref:DUF4892 domain-containing protein n=1 Tax=Oceaniserpentilla sp. 4NH20-0058 TaxID=3127660 RepID=UPI00310925B7